MELRDGTVLRLTVKNFLCHKHLVVDFETSIKFIVGLNGSGKSSILDALILGLGGKAINTYRYSEIKEYIQTGAEFASIEIRLKNSGPSAYKPKEYGRYITVIREINANRSTYTIKSESDEVKARDYRSLRAILLAHNIQLDNPMSVLPQKLSKQFMYSKKSTENFKFFLRATNLAQSEEHYDKALENCAKAKEVWDHQKRICDNLKQELQKWEDILESFSLGEKNENEKKHLEQELKWSNIAEKEHAIVVERKNYQSLHDESENDKRRLNTHLASDESRDYMKRLIKRKLEENSKKDSLKDEKQMLENALNELEINLSDLNNAKSSINKVIDREETKINEFKRQIHEITSGSAAERRAALEAAAEEARAALRTADARLRTADDHLHQADAALQRQRELRRDAQRHLAAREHELRELVDNISSLVRERGSLAAYGKCAEQLARRVRDAAADGHFSRAPRGPVGAYLTVEDEQYSSVLEHLLGGSLKNYCVDNTQDAHKLYAMIREVYAGSSEPRPSVVSCEFMSHAYDTSAREARAPSALCALRALRVTDPVVHNYLVDELALETVLLVRDDECAMRLCRAPPAAAPPRRVLTLDCAEYWPAPRYRCYGGEARPARYLHASAEHALSELRRRKRQLAADAESACEAERAAAAALRVAERAHEAAAAAQRALWAERQRQKATLQSCESALTQHREPQLELQREEMTMSEKRIESEREKLSEKNKLEENMLREIDQTKEKLKNVVDQLKTITLTIKSIEEEIEQKESEDKNNQYRIADLQRKVNMNKEILIKMKFKIQQKETELKCLIEQALDGGPRIEKPRERRVVQELLAEKKEQLETQAEALAEEGFSRDTAERRERDARRRHDIVAGHLRHLERIIQEMTNMVQKHQKMCLARQKEVILFVQNRLAKFMQMRKFKGSLEIDPVQRKLSVVSAGQPSGGETTFAMMALLLALHECVDIPFFFMDEFDVFLDSVNQETVTKLLLQTARKRPTCQYVFMTPNPPDGLLAADDLHIYTMD